MSGRDLAPPSWILPTTAAFFVLFASACAHRGPPPTLSVNYAGRLPADTASNARQPGDDAAAALGWPLLNQVTLPEGTRELRISDWYSMMGGAPVAVVRLIEQRGRPASGQLVFVWTDVRAWNLPPRAGTCTKWNHDVRICARVARDTLDWPAVARRVAELGAWRMTESCATDARFIADAGELLMQRLQGTRYDQYQCNSPTYRTSNSAGRAALELYQYYKSLVAARPD